MNIDVNHRWIHNMLSLFFFFSSRRRHTRSLCDWSSDVCSSDLAFLLRAASAQATVHAGLPGYPGRQPDLLLPKRLQHAARSDEHGPCPALSAPPSAADSRLDQALATWRCFGRWIASVYRLCAEATR